MPIPDPINWTLIEDTIHQWLVEQSGLAAGHVIWGMQDAPQPPDYPFITINVIAGPDAMSPRDDVTHEYDAGGALCEEITFFYRGQRQMTVSCQYHVDLPNSNDPTKHGRAIMSRVQASLSVPSVYELLSSSGLAVSDPGNVQNFSLVIEDTWIDRSVLDVRFNLSTETFDKWGYIATATPTGTINDPC